MERATRLLWWDDVDDATRLLLAARDGDDDAFEGLVRLVQADVWRFCAYLTSPSDADDVTQDAFGRAYRALPGYRGDAPARSWLLGIARRAAADHVRAAQRRRHLLDRLRARSGGATVGDATGAVALYDLLTVLSLERRSAFVLTQLLGYSYAEAAEICGCEIGTIRSRVARARTELVDAERDHELGQEATGG